MKVGVRIESLDGAAAKAEVQSYNGKIKKLTAEQDI